MQALGVRGFGEVYKMFLDDPDFSDDEVALLHQPDPPYRSLSEPLVHTRRFFDDLIRRGLLQPGIRAVLVRQLKELWFGYRTLERLRALLTRYTELSRRQIDDELRTFGTHRVKSQDLKDLLLARPWELL
jgi:hypothetical protein